MQVVAITGATSRLGEAAAIAFAMKGWRVLVIGPDAERGRAIVERAGKNAELVLGDLFTVAGVKKIAGEITRRAPSLDLLINSAGGTFGTLTRELAPALAAAKGRVVNMVTGM